MASISRVHHYGYPIVRSETIQVDDKRYTKHFVVQDYSHSEDDPEEANQWLPLIDLTNIHLPFSFRHSLTPENVVRQDKNEEKRDCGEKISERALGYASFIPILGAIAGIIHIYQAIQMLFSSVILNHNVIRECSKEEKGEEIFETHTFSRMELTGHQRLAILACSVALLARGVAEFFGWGIIFLPIDLLASRVWPVRFC
jgi:hypothetical protein